MQLPRKPDQDMGTILKMALPGIKTKSPTTAEPTEVGNTMQWHRKGHLVAKYGLYPLSSGWRCRVKTVFGGDYWDTWLLTESEQLSLMDVPDPIGMAAGRTGESLSVRDSVRYNPLKTRQVVVEALSFSSLVEHAYDAGLKDEIDSTIDVPLEFTTWAPEINKQVRTRECPF
jgi:hypothetical protein